MTVDLVEFLKKPLYFLDAPCTKHQQLFNTTFDGDPSTIPGDSGPEAMAKAICASCAHVSECADYSKDEPFGVWGGISDWQRGIRNARGRRSLVTGPQRAAMLAEYASLGNGEKAEWLEANGVSRAVLSDWRKKAS